MSTGDVSGIGLFRIEEPGKAGSGRQGLLMQHSVVYFTVTCARADWSTVCVDSMRVGAEEGVTTLQEAAEYFRAQGWIALVGVWTCGACISTHGRHPID